MFGIFPLPRLSPWAKFILVWTVFRASLQIQGWIWRILTWWSHSCVISVLHLFFFQLGLILGPSLEIMIFNVVSGRFHHCWMALLVNGFGTTHDRLPKIKVLGSLCSSLNSKDPRAMASVSTISYRSSR